MWGGEFSRAFSFAPENAPLDVAGFPDTYSSHGLAKAVSGEHINDLPETLQAIESAASRYQTYHFSSVYCDTFWGIIAT